MKQALQVIGLMILIAALLTFCAWYFHLIPKNLIWNAIGSWITGAFSFVVAHLWVYRKDWFSK